MTGRMTGRCLCGGVKFKVAPTTHVDACHCNMCRTWTGSAFVGIDIQDGDIVFEQDDTLAWYQSSAWAKRGFCSTCGSSLFYQLNHKPEFWAISAGALSLPADAKLEKEIFIDEKPSYYDFAGQRQRLTGEEVMAAAQESEAPDGS